MQKYSWTIIVALAIGLAFPATRTKADEPWFPSPEQQQEAARQWAHDTTPARLTYEQMARTPQEYVGRNVLLKGRVIQLLEEDDDITMRVDITQGEYFWTDTIIIERHLQKPVLRRILEHDIIAVQGIFVGLTSYRSILGTKITLPLVKATEIKVWIPDERQF